MRVSPVVSGWNASTQAVRPAAGPVSTAKQAAEGGAAAGGPSFEDSLANALRQVNELQLQAEDLSRALAAGQASDLHQVMIAAEKANLALQFTLQIRNKVIEAYQEIMRIQV